ncbi:MAG: hypothetical protein O2782_12600 [bacterium]|nr:hypothetical protein [bacterium]
MIRHLLITALGLLSPEGTSNMDDIRLRLGAGEPAAGSCRLLLP